MTDTYDSTLDTLKHSRRVDELLLQILTGIQGRLTKHDESKMHPPEKEVFDKHTPKLRTLTYGSDEYRESLQEMKPALEHHYANNSHHPEHYMNGINDMTLVDLVEMICDWKAATERSDDGDLAKSLIINQSRFEIPEELYWILHNTADAFGWL